MLSMSKQISKQNNDIKLICSFNIRLSAKQILMRRAAEEHRSMSAHIEYLIERDARYAGIPIKGIVDDIGRVVYVADTPADQED